MALRAKRDKTRHGAAEVEEAAAALHSEIVAKREEVRRRALSAEEAVGMLCLAIVTTARAEANKAQAEAEEPI